MTFQFYRTDKPEEENVLWINARSEEEARAFLQMKNIPVQRVATCLNKTFTLEEGVNFIVP